MPQRLGSTVPGFGLPVLLGESFGEQDHRVGAPELGGLSIPLLSLGRSTPFFEQTGKGKHRCRITEFGGLDVPVLGSVHPAQVCEESAAGP
ncbi:hypothetical protein [Nocardia sp. NPDC052316]|uniref:hypothetical protein n=1 Tax=Nocardia sp. NPDC052316 TaxID=3364329 RepID=UPI0037CAF1EF